MEFLERFDFIVTYVQGELNKVADCLSRYYANDTWDEVHPKSHYVNADLRLDPMGEDLSSSRIAELRAMSTRRTQRVMREPLEERVREAKELDAVAARVAETTEEMIQVDSDPTLRESQATGPQLPPRVESTVDLFKEVRKGYEHDSTFAKIVIAPQEHKLFRLEKGILYMRLNRETEVVCVPRSIVARRRLTEIVIDQAHQALGHMGPQKTSEYVRRWYWWPSMGKDIQKFCDSCGTCQTTKSSTQIPAGLLHSMPIPSRPWGSIGMDFVGPFPKSLGYDYLWVVICRLTSMVHLIPIHTTVKASELAWLFVRDIVRLHGLPDSIVSDRDSKFTSKFWREVHRVLGVKLLMSTSFHPQTDGASERAIKSVGQLMRAMVKSDQTDWTEKIPMVEFAMNSTSSSTTGFAPFELNGQMPRMMSGELMATVPGVHALTQRIRDNLIEAHDAIIDSRVRQTHQANRHRRSEGGQRTNDERDPLIVGNRAYLSTRNLSLPKGRARKLLPKFLGPYEITEAYPETSNYVLDLPDELKSRGIHARFHASQLRRFQKNDEALFPHRDPKVFYDFGVPDETEWLVDEIIGHQWKGKEISFQVKWNLGDTTWEPVQHCRDLEALDRYLELHGVKGYQQLPKREVVRTRVDRR